MTERVHIEKRYGPRRETTSPVEDSRDGAAQIRGKISLFFTFIPCPSISSTIFWTNPNSFRMDQNFLNISEKQNTVKLGFKELFGHHKKVPQSQKFLNFTFH